jgi:ectoine hydroxylase-related dioxygenase (phytanoyl-CoA dioxygenase family)
VSGALRPEDPGATPIQVEAFRRDGFVVVPDLLDDAELTAFAPRLDAAVAARTAGDHRPLAERSRYEQSFLQCINLWEDHPELRPLTFHPRVGAAAATLLGADRIRLWHDQALYKETGGRATDAHQDQPYWPIEEADTVTAWIPLDGVGADEGWMGYVPGSHRSGLRRFVNIFLGAPEDIVARPELGGVAPVFVPVPRGAVAFHHGLTVHLAGPNRSSRPRRVHTMIFFRDGCRRAVAGVHPSVDRAGIRPGEPIASDATPVAWPLPAGAWPGTPTSQIGPEAIGRHLWPPAALAPWRREEP